MGIPDPPFEKRRTTVSKRQKLQREALLSELRKNSVMTVACQKSGIPRSTVYRWMKDDTAFAEAVEEAESEGRDTVNDMAESVVIKKVREESLPAAKYWLSHNKNQYRTWGGGYRNFDTSTRRELQRLKDAIKSFFDDHFRKKKEK